jgi:hypothetical protein
MEGWFSASFQALIFSRRQTQQRFSSEKGATCSPQITHLPRFAGLRNAEALMGIAISVSAVTIVGLAGFLRFITP